MALFPRCTFDLRVPGGRMLAGTSSRAFLVIETPAPIPRAQRVVGRFMSEAWATYGSGRKAKELREHLFEEAFEIDLPGGLPAGTHALPLLLELPAWLPPAFEGEGCGVEHSLFARLDVGWAVDPTATLTPVVAMAPRPAHRSPFVGRSPESFHEEVILDLTLDSAVITEGEPLVGTIALRAGEIDEEVELEIVSTHTIAMGEGLDRDTLLASVVIPEEDLLEGGEPVRFELRAERLLPSFDARFLRHDVVLVVHADVPEPPHHRAFEIPIEVLPRHSLLGASATDASAARVHAPAHRPEVGVGDGLRRHATALAAQTGLGEAHPPALVEGVEGAVRLRLLEAEPRGATRAIEAELTFPDVELGLWRGPVPLRRGAHRERPDVSERDRSAFVRALLAGHQEASDVELSDRHLALRFELPEDDVDPLVALARAARERARAVTRAIADLPFVGPLGARPAWEAAAAERGAILVPTGPALHGIELHARTAMGEERAFRVTVRTVWANGAPGTEVDVDLRGAPLPTDAWGLLEGGQGAGGKGPGEGSSGEGSSGEGSGQPGGASEALGAIRAAFPAVRARDRNGYGAVLRAAEWAADPRTLFGALEAFVDFVLDARGERRARAAYR